MPHSSNKQCKSNAYNWQKTKQLRKVKQNWKRLISAFFFVPFRKGVPLDKKRMRAHEIVQIVQTRILNDEHI